MPDNKTIVTKLLDAVWTKGQLAIVDELVSKDFVGYWPLRLEPVKGLAEYKELVTETRRIFPDQTVKILEQIGEGEIVATRIQVTGTQRAEFLTVPPTHKSVTVEGLVLSRIVHGKLVETRTQMDVFAIFRALGMVSPNIAMPAHAVAH